MSGNLGYTRKFIILREEYSNMVNLNPKGHGKLEIRGIKGLINLIVENGEKESTYNVLALNPINRNSPWEIGRLYTDDIGRGRGEFTFNPRELEGRGFPIDKINGILILRDDKILLGGYINKEDGSLERYKRELSKQTVYEDPVQVEEIQEPIEEPVEVEEVEEHIEEIMEEIIEKPVQIEEIPGEIEEPIEELHIEEVQEEIIESVEEEIYEEIYEEPIEEIYEELQIDEIVEEPIVDSIPLIDQEEDFEHYRKLNQRNQTVDYILNILRFFPYIDPFKYELRGYNFWKIELEESDEHRGFLPYFSYVTGGNTKYSIYNNSVTSNELIRKHRHYLFGLYYINQEVRFYVYGVPGGFMEQEHPHGGVTGFNTWFEGQGIEGYWLMYIDPMTGRIIYPINPMVPVE